MVTVSTMQFVRYQGDQNMKSWPRIQTTSAGQQEGDNKSGAPFMKTPSSPALISSSFSLSGLCHRYHSFLTPVCPSLLSHRPISFSVGRNCLFFGGLFMGGKNTPLFQAASSLSAHHAEHDSPPSLWCWDELYLLSPRGVKFFCLVLSFLNFIFQTADQYRVRKQTLPALDCVHKQCVLLQPCGLGHVPRQSRWNDCFSECRDFKVWFATCVCVFVYAIYVELAALVLKAAQCTRFLNSSLLY